jgi:hypothetical protein
VQGQRAYAGSRSANKQNSLTLVTNCPFFNTQHSGPHPVAWHNGLPQQKSPSDQWLRTAHFSQNKQAWAAQHTQHMPACCSRLSATFAHLRTATEATFCVEHKMQPAQLGCTTTKHGFWRVCHTQLNAQKPQFGSLTNACLSALNAHPLGGYAQVQPVAATITCAHASTNAPTQSNHTKSPANHWLGQLATHRAYANRKAPSDSPEPGAGFKGHSSAFGKLQCSTACS